MTSHSNAIVINKSSLLLLDDEQEKEFGGMLAKAQELVNVEIKPISNPIEERELSEFLARGKKAEKAIDKTRRSVTDPLNEQVKAINDLFRPLSEAVKKVLSRGGGVLLAYQVEQRKERERLEREAREAEEKARREEAEARAKVEAAETEEERRKALRDASAAATNQALIKSTLAMTPKAGCSTDSGKSNTRRVWTFEVENEKKIPREYLTLDEKKVRDAIDFGIRNIPGLRIFEKDVLAIRTK